MDTHQGYTASVEHGAQCTACEDWIPQGEACVLMLPATVDERGGADTNAMAFHGLLCMGCFTSK